MKANEINNNYIVWDVKHSKAETSFNLVDYKIAQSLTRYASINWKACFTKEETRQFARDILADTYGEILSNYLAELAEDIDNARIKGYYDKEAIDLYSKAKDLYNRYTA